MLRKSVRFILTLSLSLVTLAFTKPRSPLSVLHPASLTNDQPELNFPNSITFHADIESGSNITSVVLEYGTDEQTCGTVIAKAYPQFVPGESVTIEWTWEMRQSGSLPPGATIWWRWRISDETGFETLTEQKNVTWLDAKHDWQTVTSGLLNLHWYSGDQTFAQDLLDAADIAIQRLQSDAGLQPDQSIHLYIYGNTDDMKDAILYEPSWTGGMAFPEFDIVIIGIAPSDIKWGRDTIAHELTHVLVGHLTFSCLGDVPTWLNEGLAVYAEGELDLSSQNQLNEAIRNDELLTVRSLSGGFSEVPSRAYLSYSQSYSIVKFLIETYSRDKMNSLLITLRDGTTIDDALLKIYGFDIDGLESAWRDSIGAAPRFASANPTPQPTPTFVPTYVPYAGAPLATTPTPFVIPTSSASGGGPADQPSGPPMELTIILAATCCVLILILVVIGLGLFLSAQKRKGESHETK